MNLQRHPFTLCLHHFQCARQVTQLHPSVVDMVLKNPSKLHVPGYPMTCHFPSSMIQRLVAKRVTLPATQLAPPLVHERLDSWIPRISTGPEQPGLKPMLGSSWSIYECHLSHLLDLKMITFHPPPFCLHKPEAETTTALRHLPFLFQVRKRQTATYALFNLDGCVIQLRSCHPCPSTGLNF